MEELLQLIHIIKNKGQRSLQLVNQNFRKKEKSKDNILYNGLVNHEFIDEVEAAKKLFKTDPGNRNFRNTKAKLKQKLLNNLFFLDYHKSEYTAFQKTYYESLSQLHQIKILIMEGANCIALKKIPGLVKTAIEFELFEIALDALIISRNEFSRLGKCTPLNMSESDINAIRPIKKIIDEIEDLYYDTLVMMNKSISSCEKIMKDIPNRIRIMERESKKYRLRRLDILANKLKFAYHHVNQNHEGILEVCSYLESKYINDGYENLSVDLDYKELIFLKLYSLYVLNRNDDGNQYASDTVGFFKPGSFDWFKFKEYQFLILMKAEKFHQATNTFRTVRMNKSYTKIANIDKERWKIYRVYLLFVNDSKLIKWGFDIEKFKAHAPDFKKELEGYNIATLIIQFLFFLREADIKNLKIKLKHLSRLSSVHLDKRHNYRNSIFIRMLEIIIEKEFNYGLVLEKGSTYYKKLVTTQIPPQLSLELEVIPYEKLWEYILNILKTNKYYLHYRFYSVHPVQ
jgi:hypothetical protein